MTTYLPILCDDHGKFERFAADQVTVVTDITDHPAGSFISFRCPRGGEQVNRALVPAVVPMFAQSRHTFRRVTIDFTRHLDRTGRRISRADCILFDAALARAEHPVAELTGADQ